MTSEVRDCFVYITLPGQTEAVTAGRFQLTTPRSGSPVGQFVYGRSYLERADKVEIDPVELKLREKPYTTARTGGIFGALRDAAPDSWGRRLIERHLKSPGELPEIDYLLNSPEDRAGALGFGLGAKPPAPVRSFNRTMDLGTLIEITDEIIRADSDPTAPKPTGPDAEQAERLVKVGTAMGGARPKATVEDGDHLWLAKFPHRKDIWNNPRVEHSMMVLAHRCGLSAADTRIVSIGDRDVLLVKRFDRHRTETGWQRSRMVSGLTMLGVDEADHADWSYLALADEVRRFSGRDNRHELEELFRRICFNALVSNIDDHPRNHAFLALDRSWSLSPAYDLTPTPSTGSERHLAMSLGRHGRLASRRNLLSECGRFGLDVESAAKIVDGMTDIVQTQWYAVCRQAGVTERDCELIRSAFVHEGFFYEVE